MHEPLHISWTFWWDLRKQNWHLLPVVIDTLQQCKGKKVTFHCFWQAVDEAALEEKLGDDSEDNEKEVRTVMKYNKQGEF